MQITDIRIRKVDKHGKMKAVVSITIDDAFVVHDIKIIEGEKGLFIAMPSRKASDGEYRDIAHPINSGTREKIQKMILDKYDEVLSETAEFCYKVNDFWHPNDEGGLAWNDPAIGIQWPDVTGEYHGTPSAEGYCMADGTPLTLSEKDQEWPGLKK